MLLRFCIKVSVRRNRNEYVRMCNDCTIMLCFFSNFIHTTKHRNDCVLDISRWEKEMIGGLIKGIWKCVNFAKTFIPKITQAQNTKITYTKMNTVFIYISQREIVLWILIMKSIIALSVVGSWWIDGKNYFVCF